MSTAALSSRHWFGRASAGFLLGFGLALAATGLFAWFGPGGIDAGIGKTQLNMWLMTPVWMVCLGLCFLFRSGARAWLWLGLANVLAFALLFGGRTLAG